MKKRLYLSFFSYFYSDGSIALLLFRAKPFSSIQKRQFYAELSQQPSHLPLKCIFSNSLYLRSKNHFNNAKKLLYFSKSYCNICLTVIYCYCHNQNSTKGSVMRSFRLYSSTPAFSHSKVWAEIDTEALANNYRLLCKKTPGTRHICVVKADAYGHTAAICTEALLDAGCDFFAVSCIEEAIEVREHCRAQKQAAEILILGYTDPQYAKTLAKYNIIQAVISEDHALSLANEAKSSKCKVRVHIALDTGMNRIGICARNESEVVAAAETIRSIIINSSLSVEGMFTHFAKADEEAEAVLSQSSHTRAQAERFIQVRQLLKD